MLNVSAKWQRAVMLDNDINVNCFADMVTASGEKIPISDSELWANGFEVNDSTSSNGTFTIGALIAGKLKIKLNNIYEDYSKYDFDKASVTAYISKSFSDGTTEKLKIGEYRVSETSYDGSLITLTCLDNINNFNREYDSNLSYPTTAYEVVRDACIKCDVPFTMARFDNSDYVINEIPSDNQKLTYGQVIAYILQLSGLWGKCGHDGELLIEWYDMSQFGSQNYNGGTFSTKTTPYSDGDSVDGGNFTDYSSGDSADGGTFTESRNYHNIYTQKDLNVATDDVVITGVKVTVTSKEDKTKDVNALAGKEGYVVSISDNPFIPADKAQTVANYIFKKIGGMRFRPLDATLLSNPLIESGDVALVTDRKQNTYSCFISNRTFTVGSGTKISCDAENASRNSADKFSNETKAIVQARKVAQAQLSVYDKQMQLLTQLMSQSLGLFKTEQKQEDGSIIYIMHNKADLNSSNIQWKMTANGMAVSSDYGKTWNAGIDKDGNAIFNIMSAIGINFDWAHGGTLTLGGENNTNGKQYVKDANGKTLVTLDNKGIALDSSVKIAWDNVAEATAKVTQITKDTVTTSYVNALSVKAGSVDAEDITGTTITGKNIVGGTIDIGNGAFAVDNDGKVTASNFNMSGGSIALNGNLSNSTIDLTATDNSGNNYELWMNGAVLRIVKNDENLITLYGATGSIGAQTMYAQEIGSDKFREADRGYAMCGDATGHTYHCGWNGSALSFQVDTTWVWSSSDKHLKKNIKAINQDYIDAVGSVDLFQYNLNRQGYSDKPLYFGAMAQDIIENLKDKGHVNENLDMIFQNKATSDDDTLYYGMNYEQFLILRLAGDEQKIDKMQKRIDELEDKFSRLCQKLGIDESEV
uniref:Endosialidase chaperone n=1 Tax=virus sp. ctReX5 TaxID=2825818 RepID=A0A8S5RL80_9VIRU|nr:MAG TPA: endosialidase chaperone [virus sp. ctReX5]